MSNAMPSPSDAANQDRDPRLYVEDMLEFCNTALGYTHGFDQPGLLADRMRYDATLRNIELIGEACTHVPAPLRALAPDIPWRQIVGTRNRLAQPTWASMPIPCGTLFPPNCHCCAMH